MTTFKAGSWNLLFVVGAEHPQNHELRMIEKGKAQPCMPMHAHANHKGSFFFASSFDTLACTH